MGWYFTKGDGAQRPIPKDQRLGLASSLSGYLSPPPHQSMEGAPNVGHAWMGFHPRCFGRSTSPKTLRCHWTLPIKGFRLARLLLSFYLLFNLLCVLLMVSQSCEKTFDFLQLLFSLLMLFLLLDNSTLEQLHLGEEHLGQSLERVQLTEDDAPKCAQLLL